ncbi:MAG: hydrolase [Leptospira sp.]|nr:hydrolase [Leptospira sp.]NCS94774.1 hydrolase [Leptospira sp.]
MNNINQLTIQNSVLALIDHQPFVAFPIQSITATELINNATALAKVGKELEIPTVLTTINAKGGPLNDPLFVQISSIFPNHDVIDRVNTNAWSDPKFKDAIKATKRKKIIMAGLWTEVCLAQTAISAMKDGYEVFFVSDASGGLSPESHNDAKLRMIQAGAQPLTWAAVMAELCPDNTTEEYKRLYSVVIENGQGVSAPVQYIMANLNNKN